MDWDWTDGTSKDPDDDAEARRHPADEWETGRWAEREKDRRADAPREESAGPQSGREPSRSPAAQAPPAGHDPSRPPDSSARPRPGTAEERAAVRERRRRQLRRRRLIALAVLAGIAVVLVVLIVLVTRGCGGSPTADAGAKPSPSPTALRTPTASKPLRMAAYGESVGGGGLLGVKMLTEDRKDIKVHRFVKVASGLTRPDFFDWPAYLEADIDKRKQPFEAVMLMFGANDGQGTKVDGKKLDYGSGSWKTMYAERVGEVMDLYLKRGVKKVYWVGMPRMGIGWFNERMELMNGIYEAEAAKRAPKVEYVDAWTIVDAPAKTYQADYRQEDGVHLTVEAGVKVAQAVLKSVARDWHLPEFKE